MNKGSFDKVAVFFATIPQALTDKNTPSNTCFCAPSYFVDNPIRQKDIDLTINPLSKKQRYYVWQLLCYALKSKFGDDFNQRDLTKDQNGKWHCPLCQISLAHSQNMVVVALSNLKDALGVDVEKLRPTTQKLADKILVPCKDIVIENQFPSEPEDVFLKKIDKKLELLNEIEEMTNDLQI